MKTEIPIRMRRPTRGPASEWLFSTLLVGMNVRALCARQQDIASRMPYIDSAGQRRKSWRPAECDKNEAHAAPRLARKKGEPGAPGTRMKWVRRLAPKGPYGPAASQTGIALPPQSLD